MRDCPNAEMRDRLPDLATGTLTGADLEAVRAHLGDCDDCREELALIQAVRSMATSAPAMNAERIAAALPSARQRVGVQRSRWGTPLRIAAALTAIAVGAGTWQATRLGEPAHVAIAPVSPAPSIVASVDTSIRGGSSDTSRNGSPAVTPASRTLAMGDASPVLSLEGGLGDLTAEQLDALATELEGLKGDALVGAEPTESVLPAIASEPLPPTLESGNASGNASRSRR